jgi:hypothetical protein
MWVDLDTVDVDAGRRANEINLSEELAAERAEFKTFPVYKKVYRTFC